MTTADAHVDQRNASSDATEPAPELARPMRADARRNRDKVIAAARGLLQARGGEVSMEEIAKTADVGVGTIYRHFPRRIDLVEAVYREDVDGLVALAERLAGDAEPWAALEQWLHGFLRYAASKRTFLAELHEAFEKNPDLAVGSREKIRSAAGAVLARAQEAGAARRDIDGADLMHLVAGMCTARNAQLDQNARLLAIVLDGIRSTDRAR